MFVITSTGRNEGRDSHGDRCTAFASRSPLHTCVNCDRFVKAGWNVYSNTSAMLDRYYCNRCVSVRSK